MLELLQKTYRNKKVFLTGHTGFKGSWLTLILQELGAEVKGYSLAPEKEQSLYNQINGDTLCQSVIADIRDLEHLTTEMVTFQPDFVIHMAAQALVIDSYKRPVETYATNVMGTIHVLEALKRLEKPVHSVIITTDKVYENLEVDTPYKEEDRLGGYDPYSNSKACAELATSSYRLSFFHPDRYADHQKWIATARSGNVIGGGDWSDNRIIPDLIRAKRAGEPLTVRNPAAVRPWQHVLEPLGAYLLLGAHLERDGKSFSGGYNFGPQPDDELNVQGLVEIALDCWGSGQYEAPPLTGQPHEAGLLKLDINKAKEQLNWAPKLKAHEGIRKTIEWYKNFESDPKEYTLHQIKEYFALWS